MAQTPYMSWTVRDNSGRDIPANFVRGLSNPLYMGFAKKGPLNRPYYGNISFLATLFGIESFTEGNDYFKYPNYAAANVASIQNIWFTRLGDEATMEKASGVLFVTALEKDLVQYERNADGSWQLDVNGDPVPKSDGLGGNLTEPGLELTFSFEAVPNGETYKSIASTGTTSVAPGKKIPLLGFEAAYFGAYGNGLGFKLYYSKEFDVDSVANIASMLYRFEPVEVDSISGEALPILNAFNQKMVNISFKEDSIDPDLAKDFYINKILTDQYVLNDETDPGTESVDALGMNVHVFTANFSEVLTLADTLMTEHTTAKELINFVSALDGDGNPYDHLAVTNTSSVFDQNRINYLVGGDDGTVTDQELADQTAAFLTATTFPEIKDPFRFPITHIDDVGYPMDVKYRIIDFMGIRNDVFVSLSTQDVTSATLNTSDEDYSVAIALNNRGQLHPQAPLEGTTAMRMSIYTQAGDSIAYPNHKYFVPMTVERAIKRARHDGGLVQDGIPAPGNRARVESITNLNWTPIDEVGGVKSLLKNVGAIYAQHYDVGNDSIYIPDYWTIYADGTSRLNSEHNVYRLVYMHHICRRIHAFNSFGAENLNTDAIAELMETEIYRKLGTAIQIDSIKYTPTLLSDALGYTYRYVMELRMPGTSRVSEMIINVDRL